MTTTKLILVIGIGLMLVGCTAIEDPAVYCTEDKEKCFVDETSLCERTQYEVDSEGKVVEYKLVSCGRIKDNDTGELKDIK